MRFTLNNVLLLVSFKNFIHNIEFELKKLRVCRMNRALTKSIRVCVEPIRVCPYPYPLSLLRLDNQLMMGAFFTTAFWLTVLFSWIIQHHEIVVMPVWGVIIDVSEIHNIKVLFKANIEKAIVAHGYFPLDHVFKRPVKIKVTPSSIVCFTCPRITQKQKFLTGW